MTEKRFTDDGIEDIENQSFTDNLTGKTYWIDHGLDEIVDLLNTLNDENEQIKKQQEENIQFLIKSAKRLGFQSLDHLLYTLDKGEITGYSTANWRDGGI